MPSNDPHFGNVKLLLHCDGADNGTTFSDLTGKTVTPAGNVATKTGTKKYGTASAYFDGSGDYLSTGSSADFDFGSDDFTVECWVYQTARSAVSALLARWASTAGKNFSWRLLLQADGTPAFQYGYGANSVAATDTASAAVALNTWTHVAASCSSGTIRVFVDGAVVATHTRLGTLTTSAAAVQIGRNEEANTWYLTGYLDDVRITKGVARYTGTFTPPTAAHPNYGRYIAGDLTEATDHTEFIIRAHRLDTGAPLNEITATGSSYECPCCPAVAPYTDYSGPVMIAAWPRLGVPWTASAVKTVGDYVFPADPVTTPYVFKCDAADAYASNVKLLMHMEGTDDSTTGFVDMTGKTVTPAGNVKHENTQKKFGSTSAYFDGADDYLSMTDTSLNVSTGDFTAECWVYLTAMTAVQGVFFWGNPASNANRIQLDVKTDGSVAFYMEDGAAGWSGVSTGIGAITANAWHHVAIVRNGSTLRVFVDGIKVGGDATQTITVSVGATLYLGTARNAGVQRYLTGYLDEVRVTVGTARYTADFTPPSAPFYVTGPTEPEWPTTAGATVNDGDLTWTCVDRMLQPVLHGPLIPSL